MRASELGRPFVDTNVLLYLLSSDADKANRAEELLARRIVVSVQVLNEYYSVMLKNKADDALIQANIQTILDRFEICWFSADLLKQSYSLRNR